MTTHVMDRRTNMRGVLVRLIDGEPSVRWFGDQTEYRPSWDRVEVISSDEYALPRGEFQHELWVDGNGDAWRRKVLENAWPCELGMTHLVGARSLDDSPLCWHCGSDSREWASVEIFVLVSAEGFPADCPTHPQSRAEVEEFAGDLLRAGSPEAHARATSLTEPTRDAPGCWMRGSVGVLSALVLLVVLLAVWRLAIG